MRASKYQQKSIARDNIEELFRQAEETFDSSSKLADRYVELALKIRDKAKVKLTKDEKRRFCKKCHSYLKPGNNCTARVKNKVLLLHCKTCDNIRRICRCKAD